MNNSQTPPVYPLPKNNQTKQIYSSRKPQKVTSSQVVLHAFEIILINKNYNKTIHFVHQDNLTPKLVKETESQKYFGLEECVVGYL